MIGGGAISIFVPNGYLLYNFAGTLTVDLDRKKSKILFLCFTLMVNIIWMCGIGGKSKLNKNVYLFHSHFFYVYSI